MGQTNIPLYFTSSFTIYTWRVDDTYAMLAVCSVLDDIMSPEEISMPALLTK